jgi:hypothetical protein
MDAPLDNHPILNIYSSTMIFMLKHKKYGKSEKNSISKYYLIWMILFSNDIFFLLITLDISFIFISFKAKELFK